MIAVKEPCPECPFSRTVTPGALGGTRPDAYVGQAAGPFTLPCHKHCDFDDPEWKGKAVLTPQCAGAAIYRTHIGVADRMPEGIPILPANPQVFSSAAEFVSHHTGKPLAETESIYSAEKVRELTLEQLIRATKGMKP